MKIGNFAPDANCLSEIAVFASDNAMNFLTPISTWTAGNDVLTITQSGLLTVPLTVWTLSGLPDDATVNASLADQIYNKMQVGLRFSLDIRDSHTQSAITGASCEDLGPLLETFPPVAKRITVYYVPEVTAVVNVGNTPTPFMPTGRWCEKNPNIVLIGAFGAETLAHELGHAFSLDHTDSSSLPPSNLMFSQDYPRDSLTIGQAFRINVDTDSRINVNGVRTGPTQSCPDLVTSVHCPALTLDALPK